MLGKKIKVGCSFLGAFAGICSSVQAFSHPAESSESEKVKKSLGIISVQPKKIRSTNGKNKFSLKGLITSVPGLVLGGVATVAALIKYALVRNNYGHTRPEFVPLNKGDMGWKGSGGYNVNRDIYVRKRKLEIVQNMIKDAKGVENFEAIKKLVLANKEIPKKEFDFGKENIAYKRCKEDPRTVDRISESLGVNKEKAWEELREYFKYDIVYKQDENHPGDYDKMAQNQINYWINTETDVIGTGDVFCYLPPRGQGASTFYYKENKHFLKDKLNPNFDVSDYSPVPTQEYKYPEELPFPFSKMPDGMIFKVLEKQLNKARQLDEAHLAVLCPLFSKNCHPNEDELLGYINEKHKLLPKVTSHARYMATLESMSFGSYEDYNKQALKYFNYPKKAIEYFSKHLKK